MWIIGHDFHPRYQQIAAFNSATGDTVKRRLRQGAKLITLLDRCTHKPTSSEFGYDKSKTTPSPQKSTFSTLKALGLE